MDLIRLQNYDQFGVGETRSSSSYEKSGRAEKLEAWM